MNELKVLASLLLVPWLALAVPIAGGKIKGFNLTEVSVHRYDAFDPGPRKSEAQIIVDKLHALGVRHIALSPRGIMRTPYDSCVAPLTKPEEMVRERAGYLRLIEYIHRKGMTVGIRPLLFVVDDILNPYIEFGRPIPRGGVWWHGNIQPKDPIAWFECFRNYLDPYMDIARVTGAEEFTIGAELNSMTVGIEGAPKPYDLGLPGEWVKLVAYVRQRLPNTRLMYDINFTDDEAFSGPATTLGGEFARWCQRLAHPPFAVTKTPVGPDPKQHLPAVGAGEPGQNWAELVSFWRGLDAVGLDFYRSLARPEQVVPRECPALVPVLKQTSDRFASQVDNCLFDINSMLGGDKPLIIKDTGYRSIEQGYLDPYKWAGPGAYNECHQAASYEAIFQSFWKPRWWWFQGIVWWDASVDLDKHGIGDTGFSPIGKPMTEKVIKSHFLPDN